MATVVPYNGEWVAFDEEHNIVAHGSTRELAATYAGYNNYVVKYGTEKIGNQEALRFGNIVITAKHVARLQECVCKELSAPTEGPSWLTKKLADEFPDGKRIRVPSATGKGHWTVTIYKNGKIMCDCPAFLYDYVDKYGFCKHVATALADAGIPIGYKNGLLAPTISEMLKDGSFANKAQYDMEVKRVMADRASGKINETEKNFQLKQLREKLPVELRV